MVEITGEKFSSLLFLASEVQSGSAVLEGQMKDLNTGIANAEGCMDMAIEAISSVKMPDMETISKNAEQQAQAKGGKQFLMNCQMQ